MEGLVLLGAVWGVIKGWGIGLRGKLSHQSSKSDGWNGHVGRFVLAYIHTRWTYKSVARPRAPVRAAARARREEEDEAAAADTTTRRARARMSGILGWVLVCLWEGCGGWVLGK